MKALFWNDAEREMLYEYFYRRLEKIYRENTEKYIYMIFANFSLGKVIYFLKMIEKLRIQQYEGY